MTLTLELGTLPKLWGHMGCLYYLWPTQIGIEYSKYQDGCQDGRYNPIISHYDTVFCSIETFWCLHLDLELYVSGLMNMVKIFLVLV